MKTDLSGSNPHIHISGDGDGGHQTMNVSSIISATKEEWEEYSGVISKRNRLYVITDYYTDSDGVNHPAIKIGDGKAYIGDLPLVSTGGSGDSTEELIKHMQDDERHITQEERELWNDKVGVKIVDGKLIFTTTEDDGGNE